MSTKIEYNNSIVAEIPNGSTAKIPVRGKEMATDILVTVPKAEVIPDHTDTDFALHYSSEDGAINVVYSSTEKASFDAAPDGAVIDSFGDGHFTPSNIKSGVSIFGLTGTYADSAVPTEVSTEADMTALLESGEVGGVYKYVGETTETYENGALYVLEKKPDPLQGTWVFNDTITFLDGSNSVELNFTANGTEYVRMVINGSDTSSLVRNTLRYRFVGSGVNFVEVYKSGAWRDVVYRTVQISSVYDDVVNASTFLTWLQANATKQ